MPIPINFRKSGEGAIASYDFVDIADGIGYVKQYGFSSGVSGSKVSGSASRYGLTKDTLYSSDIETALGSGNVTVEFNSSAFNLPRVVKGTAIVRFSAWTDDIGSGVFFTAYVMRVDANEIATSIGSQIFPASGFSNQNRNFTVRIPLTTTQFKKGDVLRLRIYKNIEGGNWTLGHDPANRNGAVIADASITPTKLEIYIPFKVDL